MRALVFDVETTGLLFNRILPLAKQPEVIDLYMADVDLATGQIVDEWEQLFKPSGEWSEDAEKVHGITQEMIKDAPRFAECADGIKEILERAECVIAHNCVSGSVEVLTLYGWCRLDRLEGYDGPIMQWNSSTNVLTWGDVVAKHEALPQPMYVWDTTYHSCAYTGNHRMYIRTPHRDLWFAEKAELVQKRQPNSVYIPISGIYETDDQINLAPLEARLMEAIRADGSWCSRRGAGVKFHFKKARKIIRLRSLLSGLGLDCTTTKIDALGAITITTHKSPLLDRIFDILGHDKKYGQWVLDLPLPAREAILDEAEFWDGSSTPTCRKNTYHLTTIHKENAEAFQLMAHCSGWSAQIKHVANTWNGTQPNSKLWYVRIRKKNKVKLIQKGIVEKSEEKVYCVTVPTGAFLARSNGRVLITGNCSFDTELCDIEFERLGQKIKWKRKLCTVESTIHLKGYRLSLQDLHQLLFDVKFKEAHRARSDTQALIKCCVELYKKGVLS